MMEFRQTANPFTVQSPERLSAEEVCDLFVPVFSDYPELLRASHVFVHGPRGCGKSMMLRYMLPDCQMMATTCSLDELEFFAVYVPIKKTELPITEVRRLADHANALLNEHLMAVHFASRLCESLAHLSTTRVDCEYENELTQFSNRINHLLRRCGWPGNFAPSDTGSCTVVFRDLGDVLEDLYYSMLAYLRKLAYRSDVLPYDGPLCGYLDFLFPLVQNLQNLSFLPSSPYFLLVDDADNLTLPQTHVLNSWVSCRTQAELSVKATTQLNYKTWRTTAGHTIDTPHDFAEVDVARVYTAKRNEKYREWIADIVEKRLVRCGLGGIKAKQFFPPDQQQEAQIKRIADDYRSQTDEEARGACAGDDAYRYARPDFMRGLAGASKSSSSYSYAGFEQLTHISSGIVRYFLESAARMFSHMQAYEPEAEATHIPPSVQNKVIKEFSEERFFAEFDKMLEDEDESHPPRDQVEKLRNLIRALGGTFRLILLSDRSERRVFSVALSDEPDEELRDVLHLGVRRGFFHESAIGNKEGTGRTPLYILNRLLAPHFNLDPTSFAGYLFVTNAAIHQAMLNPRKLLRKVKDHGVASVFEPTQLPLF